MKSAWFTLLISALTDFMITAGTAFLVLPPDVNLGKRQVLGILIGGGVAFARTIQQKLNATPDTVAALKGSVSSVVSVTETKTP